LAALSAQNWMI